MKNWQIYSLLKKFLKGTTVHLRGRLDAGYVQKRRRQVDVQNYVVYSATSYRCFIVIQYCSTILPTLRRTSKASIPYISSFAIPFHLFRFIVLQIFDFFLVIFNFKHVRETREKCTNCDNFILLSL